MLLIWTRATIGLSKLYKLKLQSGLALRGKALTPISYQDRRKTKMKDFEVDVILTLKHHIIREGLKNFGWTQKRLAEYLSVRTAMKVRPHQVSAWIGLKNFPRNEKVLAELENLFACSREELFPAFLQDKNFLKRTKTFERKMEFTPAILAGYHTFALPESPEDVLCRQETERQIGGLLDTLSAREAEVLKLRFGFDGAPLSLDQIAEKLGTYRNKIHEIEVRALQKLRHPVRLRILGQ